MGDRSEQAKLIFLEAIENQAPEQWPSFLDQACGGDGALHAAVAKLLRAHAEIGSFHEQAPADSIAATGDEPAPERPGSVVGPYKLLEQIGEGGFGVVFRAEQAEPVRRQVALKVLKPGMDTRQVLARFEQERLALALMDHPNIARVLDAGVTASGRPYFAMELVQGLPITEYCDQARLPPRDRLELGVTVCRAVQHAHQKGIVHRDLKPSNILVASHDGRPVPKVIDFGVAKATGPQLTEKSLFTLGAQMVGTPLYMAPEQAGAAPDVDTRSDVYALGVLLYELLTGTTPFDRERFRNAGYDEIRRIIREEEPPRPSTRLGTVEGRASIAASRGLEPRQLSGLVRGDLDWIVMKCLEKDRERRYETANGLAMDLQRYLADEPVAAGPPSRAYRLKKFLRRNRGPVVAAAAIVGLLLAGTVGTAWQAIRAERSRQEEEKQRKLAETNEAKAEQEKQVAQAVRDFLQKRLLLQADPTFQADALLQAGGAADRATHNPTIRELLDRASAELTPEKIETQFLNQPVVQAEILGTIGRTYIGVGDYEPAIAHLRRAHRLYELHQGSDHSDTLTTLSNLSLAHLNAGKFQEAIPLLEQLRDKQLAARGPDHHHTLIAMGTLARAYRNVGRMPEAIALLESVRERFVATLGPDHPYTLLTVVNLGDSYLATDRNADAIRLLEPTRDQFIAKLGADHPHTLVAQGNLAVAYRDSGRAPEAITLFQRVHEQCANRLGSDHPDTLISLCNLAMTYQAIGKLPEAVGLFEQARDGFTAKLGPDHPLTLTSGHNLAVAYRDAGRFPEATGLLEEVLERRVAKLPAGHPHIDETLATLGETYVAARQFDRAATHFRALVDHERNRQPTDERRLAGNLAQLASSLLREGQPAEAEAALRECLAIRSMREPNVWTTFNTRSMLGAALLGQRKHAEAEPFLLEGYEGMRRRQAEMPSGAKDRLPEAAQRLVRLYGEWGKPEQAEKWRSEVSNNHPSNGERKMNDK
jgi:serine/threonine protein kinase/tetratricopeptide (TPR) repeat protein